MSAIHRLVLADMERSRANAELTVERLRLKREGISTVGTSGHGRALQVAKLLREAEAIARGWRIAVAAVLAEETELRIAMQPLVTWEPGVTSRVTVTGPGEKL